MEPALSVPQTTSFPVKGRQGLMINQKLSFGDYKTSRVKRSWTRGRNTRIDVLSGQAADPAYPNLVSLNYNNRDQSYHFQMTDFFGNVSDIYAASGFFSKDLQIGDNPNSIINILEDLFSGINFSSNVFYLQVFLNEQERPWQLVLDNDAAQFFAKEYTGLFAIDKYNYYTLKPITRVQGKKGPEDLIMGSVGYEIFNNKEESVAAVSLVDNGTVYLHTKDPDERFLMSNLCAALLLQEEISE
ncbi:hypothetical protein GCM10010465_24750 [Actinomadura fibrosa]